MIVPILGARSVPGVIRIGLGLLLTLAVAPLLPPGPAIEPFSAEGLLVTASQILIGLTMGVAIRMVFSAVETGGNVIGQTMGLGFAQMMDPANGVTVPVISQFYSVMATLIFLALNGHLILIEILVASFRIMPVSTESIGPGGLWLLLTWAAWIFKGAMLISLPAVPPCCWSTSPRDDAGSAPAQLRGRIPGDADARLRLHPGAVDHVRAAFMALDDAFLLMRNVVTE